MRKRAPRMARCLEFHGKTNKFGGLAASISALHGALSFMGKWMSLANDSANGLGRRCITEDDEFDAEFVVHDAHLDVGVCLDALFKHGANLGSLVMAGL